mmetsp:Transcript_14310/g.36164  ORF Transcript_14310/g.36164 Transcript_14310/m.36164 type:complete len:403 (-) Transcript_14310:130-1338(-)
MTSPLQELRAGVHCHHLRRGDALAARERLADEHRVKGGVARGHQAAHGAHDARGAAQRRNGTASRKRSRGGHHRLLQSSVQRRRNAPPTGLARLPRSVDQRDHGGPQRGNALGLRARQHQRDRLVRQLRRAAGLVREQRGSAGPQHLGPRHRCQRIPHTQQSVVQPRHRLPGALHELERIRVQPLKPSVLPVQHGRRSRRVRPQAEQERMHTEGVDLPGPRRRVIHVNRQARAHQLQVAPSRPARLLRHLAPHGRLGLLAGFHRAAHARPAALVAAHLLRPLQQQQLPCRLPRALRLALYHAGHDAAAARRLCARHREAAAEGTSLRWCQSAWMTPEQRSQSVATPVAVTTEELHPCAAIPSYVLRSKHRLQRAGCSPSAGTGSACAGTCRRVVSEQLRQSL